MTDIQKLRRAEQANPIDLDPPMPRSWWRAMGISVAVGFITGLVCLAAGVI